MTSATWCTSSGLRARPPGSSRIAQVQAAVARERWATRACDACLHSCRSLYTARPGIPSLRWSHRQSPRPAQPGPAALPLGGCLGLQGCSELFGGNAPSEPAARPLRQDAALRSVQGEQRLVDNRTFVRTAWTSNAPSRRLGGPHGSCPFGLSCLLASYPSPSPTDMVRLCN